MRLWTLHPKYLDAPGLVALWREALLAQAVLRNRTEGYRFHPQPVRFRAERDALALMAEYLRAVQREAERRGYRFNRAKIARRRTSTTLTETEGQLRYEFEHLKRKLRRRAPQRYEQLLDLELPEAHPLFRIEPGGVREWERISLKGSV
jgi:hypothetical protein